MTNKILLKTSEVTATPAAGDLDIREPAYSFSSETLFIKYPSGTIKAIAGPGWAAPKASPALTGTPTAPTATAGTNTTQIATCAFVQAAVGAAGGGDMLKSVYDSNNDGVVDMAAAVPWTGITGKPSAFTPDVHAHAISDVTGLQTALDAKAPLASPAFTGTPTVPTATAGTNTTQAASTAFVQAAVAALVNGAASTLDTLNELAAALGNDPNFATTVATSLGLKLDASSTIDGGTF